MIDIFAVPVGNYKDEHNPLRFQIGIRNLGITSVIDFERLEDLRAVNNVILDTNNPKVKMIINTDHVTYEGDNFITVTLKKEQERDITKRVNIIDFMRHLEDVIDDNLTPPQSPRRI